MPKLRERLDEFIALVEAGQTVEAIRRFYAEDVLVFENRELARAGRDSCVAFEQSQLAAQPAAPRMKAVKSAADSAAGTCFVEWVIHFHSSSGRPMRLEEVAAQKWSAAGIVEERFYYEGFIDEGDEEDADEGDER